MRQGREQDGLVSLTRDRAEQAGKSVQGNDQISIRRNVLEDGDEALSDLVRGNMATVDVKEAQLSKRRRHAGGSPSGQFGDERALAHAALAHQQHVASLPA